MVEIGLTALLVIVAGVLIGAIVQSVVGIGLGLVAAPLITLVAPELMPGTMLMLATVFPLITLTRERADIDWWGLAWSFPARLGGTAVGVWLVITLDARGLGIGVAVIVLIAVALTARTVRLPIHRGTLTGAGFLGGVTGTASSIGGPPFALLYQHRPARQVRTTLAVYFVIGSAMSLIGLAITGELHRDQVVVAASLVPVLVVGSLLSGVVKRIVGPESVRPAVLVVCASSALVLLVRSLVG